MAPYSDPSDLPQPGDPISPTANRPTGPAGKGSGWPSWATPAIVVGALLVGVVVWIALR